jgi:hypothetical protein
MCDKIIKKYGYTYIMVKNLTKKETNRSIRLFFKLSQIHPFWKGENHCLTSNIDFFGSKTFFCFNLHDIESVFQFRSVYRNGTCTCLFLFDQLS